MDRADAVSEVRQDGVDDADLVISGHHHVPATGEIDGIREVIAPPLCSFPHALAVLDIDERGTRVWHRSVVTAAELADGYELAMENESPGRRLALMAEDRLQRVPLVRE